MTISRRDMLKATAAAAIALPLSQCRAPSPKFFTPEEFALVDELSDMIIPTDAQSGGARAAGVAAYIDGRLAEGFEPAESSPSPEGRGGQGERTRWRAGLKAVEDLSREMNGKAFLESTPEQRLAVLTRMAAGGGSPIRKHRPRDSSRRSRPRRSGRTTRRRSAFTTISSTRATSCRAENTLASTRPDGHSRGSCGFVHIGEVVDSEDGPVWRWERSAHHIGTP